MTFVLKNSLAYISEILGDKKPNSILLVHGNNSYETSGAKDLIERQLGNNKFTSLSGFYKSPSIQDVENTIALIKEKQIDFIIGVGGGTVMDISKAASLLNKEQGKMEDYVTGKIKPQGMNITRVLIPTTSGTGAEITPFSVVYIGKTKYSIAHPSMSPEYAILDSKLTHTLSPKITAETGCDALSQAIEGFWSVNATEESKQYSREAIPIILKNLRQAVNHPTSESREGMLFGAHLAGKSISIAKTTAAHALSYPLTSYHDIPHGHAVFLTLPYFFPINEKAMKDNIQENISLDNVKEVYCELLNMLNVDNGESAKDMLLRLMEDIGLERRLSKLNIAEDDLQNIINNGFNPQRVKNNPVIITEEIEWKILREIL
jgi:alcohol dehydrogenase